MVKNLSKKLITLSVALGVLILIPGVFHYANAMSESERQDEFKWLCTALGGTYSEGTEEWLVCNYPDDSFIWCPPNLTEDLENCITGQYGTDPKEKNLIIKKPPTPVTKKKFETFKQKFQSRIKGFQIPAQEMPPSPKPVTPAISPLLTEIPEGVIIEKEGDTIKRVSLKKDYTFQRLSKSEAAVVYRSRSNVIGKVSCSCYGSGGCSIVVMPNNVFCADDGCKGSCEMAVKIPSKSHLIQPE